MVSNQFKTSLVLRLSGILLLLCALSYCIVIPGQHGLSILLTLAVMTAIFELLKYIHKTNSELNRFLDALKYRDFLQQFDLPQHSKSFADLSESMSSILQRLRESWQQQQTQQQKLRAVVEHVPVPVLSISSEGKLTLWNNSARRLLGNVRAVHIEDLAAFGDDFVTQVKTLRSSERRLAKFVQEDVTRNITIQASEVMIGRSQEKLVSLQDIQTELDEVQLRAWQDLVRVLTHEIMNSITPIASLSKTAAELLEEIQPQIDSNMLGNDELEDVMAAVNTVSRRSDGLMQFVNNYRRLTRLPATNRKNISVLELLNNAVVVASEQWPKKSIDININVKPSNLSANLDIDMVEQLLINLLLNASHAIKEKQNRVIKLEAYASLQGKLVLKVGDSGDGVAEEHKDKIFVPFFTTRTEGSGVGLALTQQVMQAHGGTVSLGTSSLGGAQFSLLF